MAELMRVYWERYLADDWPRIRSLLEQDVLYRARQIADGGTARLFCDLDPAVSWRAGVLRVECETCESDLDLDERGLSQHLAVLCDAGLLCGRRVARSVLYMRSCEGDDLLAAAGADPAGKATSRGLAAGAGSSLRAGA